MTQIEQIKAEIERLKKELKYLPSGDYKDGVFYVLEEELTPFIDTLPAEQPSEELDDEIYNYWRNELTTEDIVTISKDDFISHATHLAQWQKERVIEKAYDWLNDNFFQYGEDGTDNNGCSILYDFKHAMEDEQ